MLLGPTRIYLLLGLLAQLAWSQAPPVSLMRRNFVPVQWTSQDGLPQNTVTGIVEDEDGSLWLSTFGGLARFNGARVQPRGPLEEPGLDDRRLMRIHRRRSGNLVVASDNGRLWERSRGRWSRLALPEEGQGAGIRDLCEDGQGRLYVARDCDLLRLSSAGAERFLVGADGVYDLCCNGGGNLLVAADQGLFELVDDQLRLLRPGRHIGVAGLGDGRVAGLSRNDLVVIEGGEPRVWKVPALMTDDQRRLRRDHEGGLWIEGLGPVLRFFDGRWEQPSLDLGNPYQPQGGIRCVLPLADGSIWLGCDYVGLVGLAPTPIRMISAQDVDSPIACLAACGDGRILAAGQRIFLLDQERLSRLDDRTPMSMATSASGRPWLAYGLSLLRFDGEGIVATTDEIAADSPLAVVHEDSKGRIWLARDQRLGLIENGRERDLGAAALGVVGQPSVIFECRDGAIWIGGDQGLCRIDGGVSQVLRCGVDLPVGPIRSLIEDGRGSLWVGSYGGGLSRIRDGRVVGLGLMQGLAEDVASSLVITGEHLLVLGNRALALYRLTDLDAVAEGRLDRFRGRLFDRGPGIDLLEGNAIRPGRSLIDEEGRIYLPATKGVLVFDPRLVPAPPERPMVEIQYRRRGRDESWRDAVRGEGVGLRIEPGDRDLDLRFSGISHEVPRQVHIRYRLRDLDSDWRLAEEYGVVSYNDLEPGRYDLEVETAVADGPWTEPVATMAVIVRPVLTETLAFRGLLAVIGLGGLFAMLRYRSRLQRDRAAVLGELVSERTRELETEIVERQAVEEELRQARHELEEQVESRTADLRRALDDLQADVVRRRALEERLRAAERFEAIGRLAGGLGHDFNNVLTVVAGEADLMRLEADELDGASIVERADVITTAVHRAARVTRQLLAYSQQLVLEAEIIDPLVTIRELLAMLTRLVRDDIRIDLDPNSTSCPVLMDVGQLEQVMINLVTNAAEAMPRGGCITISSCVVATDEAGAGRATEITIRDTGVGFAPEEAEYIFEPFYSSKGVARGMGLASVSGIVRQSGGRISAESRPGEGACFRVVLPEAEGHPQAPVEDQESDPEVADLAGLKVLLVDDQRALRETLRALLGRDGLVVTEAADGLEALELAEEPERTIDLLISDIVMPGMSGVELSDRLRARRPGLRVLLISGYASDYLDDRELDERTAFLRKPFDRRALLGQIRRLLDV
ncbi:MAG: response regulator [Planctomycetes bacterium]|nr:response regulator [Planctomycetota bacterium]